MEDEWERKAKKEMVERGYDYCSTYIDQLPLSPEDKDSLLVDCLDNWLGMSPKRRAEIQAGCAITEPDDVQRCVGSEMLDPEAEMDAPSVSKCERGALLAPDEQTREEFIEWCFAQVSTPRRIEDVNPGIADLKKLSNSYYTMPDMDEDLGEMPSRQGETRLQTPARWGASDALTEGAPPTHTSRSRASSG